MLLLLLLLLLLAAAVLLLPRLRQCATAATTWPVTLTTRTPRNGEVSEHGWRQLNKLRGSFRHFSPSMADFVLLRVLHVTNTFIWHGIPAAARSGWEPAL